MLGSYIINKKKVVANIAIKVLISFKKYNWIFLNNIVIVNLDKYLF
jgi:hypothetical protein